MKFLVFIFLLIPNLLFADVLSNTSTSGVNIKSESVFVPRGYSVIITATISVSSKFPYDRNLVAIKRGRKLLTSFHGNREHEDGSTTGFSDVISITTFDSPVEGTYKYNLSWKVNKGIGYSGAQDFKVLLVKN